MSFSESGSLLRTQADVAKVLLRAMSGVVEVPVKLCGGTALSAFYLHHRLSYDLDFFLPKFSPEHALKAMKDAGATIRTLDLVSRAGEAVQLHLQVKAGTNWIKVSFIEDAYYDLFPAVPQTLGDVAVFTESIDGLYHRKLRTIVGHITEGEEPEGHRQTARDLFDLWVLTQAHMPILPFIETLPYDFPVEALKNGISDMPWFDLIPEFKELSAADGWKDGCDVEVVRNTLLGSLGMKDLGDPEFLPDEPGY